MRVFTCSTCGKEWPENYCPECAHTIDRTHLDQGIPKAVPQPESDPVPTLVVPTLPKASSAQVASQSADPFDGSRRLSSSGPHSRGKTEDDYISSLRDCWPMGSNGTMEVIALANEAVRVFPRSARLWVMRGDLIRIGPQSDVHSLEEALRSYQRAVEIDPQLVSSQTRQELRHLMETLRT